MRAEGWTVYSIITGAIVWTAQGARPELSRFDDPGNKAIGLGQYERDAYYFDVTQTETVQANQCDQFGQFGQVLYDITDQITPLTEDFIQHVPILKGLSPLADNYAYNIGGPDLAIAVSVPSFVHDKDAGGRTIGEPYAEVDGLIERSYSVPGLYSIEVREVQYLVKKINVLPNNMPSSGMAYWG